MKVLIQLVIISFNPVKKEHKVLLEDYSDGLNIPNMELTTVNNGCVDVCKDLTEYLLQTSGSLLNYKYIDNSFDKEEFTLTLTYGLLIPECIPQKHGMWFNLFGGRYDAATKELILKAIRKV